MSAATDLFFPETEDTGPDEFELAWRDATIHTSKETLPHAALAVPAWRCRSCGCIGVDQVCKSGHTNPEAVWFVARGSTHASVLAKLLDAGDEIEEPQVFTTLRVTALSTVAVFGFIFGALF